MKFIYTAGQFTTFRGRMFAFKKATDVTDRGTIEALLKHPDFMRVDNDEQKKEQAPAAPSVLKRPVLSIKGRK